MQEFLTILQQNLAIWIPALVSILATVSAIMGFTTKGFSQIHKIQESVEFKAVKSQLEVLTAENRQLIQCNKILIDKIAKIQGYTDAKVVENEIAKNKNTQ